jgi:CBS domain-containing protein
MSFDRPVSSYMTPQPEVVSASAPLTEVARKLAERSVSALPVIGADGAIVGVVSRTDLLRVGRPIPGGRGPGATMALPDMRAADLITRDPLVCTPETSLRDAARLMVGARVHRLFVVVERDPVGVISTVDMVAAVRDERPRGTLADIMTAPVVTIGAETPVRDAIERLSLAHVTGLIVVDERWPIGTFTQTEALAARDLPPETPVDDVMDPAVICLPVGTRLHHAAAQAARLDVRRVLASKQGSMVGIASGLDFARWIAGEVDLSGPTSG